MTESDTESHLEIEEMNSIKTLFIQTILFSPSIRINKQK